MLGLTCYFLAATLKQHWQAVLALRLRPQGWQSLGAGLGITLVAHVWSGAVWGGLLRSCGQTRPQRWAIATYLRTNLAKYLPGNIWHFYSRLKASQAIAIPTDAALLSIVLEPLLMAAAALFLACLTYRFSPWQGLLLVAILLGVHPRFLNPILRKVAAGKLRSLGRVRSEQPAPMDIQADSSLTDSSLTNSSLTDSSLTDSYMGDSPTAGVQAETLKLSRYPLGPLLGELLFVALRGGGFLFAVQALAPLQNLPLLISAFSLSWMLGLVIPGAPGGIGVFELGAIALLQGQLPPERVLGAVACYRLLSTLAEVLGAGLAPLIWPRSLAKDQ
ncbi:MAG: UPF0104 family protein [Synechococcales cyanobacterium RM1_1_8]|nr:UPF0104 family protein [Synechococcales cyanobacterium RM1_1_8]